MLHSVSALRVRSTPTFFNFLVQGHFGVRDISQEHFTQEASLKSPVAVLEFDTAATEEADCADAPSSEL